MLAAEPAAPVEAPVEHLPMRALTRQSRAQVVPPLLQARAEQATTLDRTAQAPVQLAEFLEAVQEVSELAARD